MKRQMKTNYQARWLRPSPACFLIGIAILLSLSTFSNAAMSRIKDIARIAGVESIGLVGYGVVAGLNRTGDKDLLLTRQTAANLLETFNITIDADDIKSKNIAVVLVTASVRPFHKEGDLIDVQVSSLGDATSLGGGVLIMTPLLDPNGEIYALAQGNITLGGFSAGTDAGGGMTVSKNHTTVGIIPGGALVKHDHEITFFENGVLRLILRHPDFTTADRMATAINKEFGGIAVAQDASAVAVRIPETDLDIGHAAAFVAKLEKLMVTPDVRARVIVNERTGTIVMGGNVSISQAVVAHGNLTVTVDTTLHPSHPSNIVIGLRDADLDIRSLETPNTITTVVEEEAHVMVVPPTTTIRDLADTLNIMGATPRDLISILEALHKLGAIQMELSAM